MSGYILCQTKKAQRPYFIENISMNIYSIEELCYYLYHNLYLADHTVFNEELCNWLRDELELVHLAAKLKQNLERNVSVEEMIYPVFKENKRCLTLINSQHGKVVQMEIGALLVGRIHNHPLTSLVKGQEKGFFGLGGSSIMVLYPKDSIELDQDIWHYSQQDIEIQVSLGERIGTYV